MSTEYFTTPAIKYEDALSRLTAQLPPGWTIVERPQAYVPECEARYIQPNSGNHPYGVHVMEETRPDALRVAEPGCFMIEVFTPGRQVMPEVFLWICSVLDVTIISQYYDETWER